MNSIKSKNINNWILAILTALGAYGGFQKHLNGGKNLPNIKLSNLLFFGC